jgi:cell division initiation protein
MDLSPNDIRNYEFSNQMRGYDKEEVDSFLDRIAEALEKVKQDNLKLSMDNDSLKAQLAGLRQFEDSIKNAAIDARRNADSTIAAAKKEAEQMLGKAKAESEKLLGNHEKKIQELKTRLAELEATRKSYFSKLRNLINSHMQMLDESSIPDIKKDISGHEESSEPKIERKNVYTPPGEKATPGPANGDNIEVTETTEVTRGEMETIASKPQHQPIRTEEANAAGDIVPAEDEQNPPAPVAKKPIDPELAAALANYKSKSQGEVQMPQSEAPVPRQGEIHETTTRAEDIPDGFVTPHMDGPSDSEEEPDTGKVQVSPDSQDTPTEHNDIDIDTPIVAEKTKKNDSGDNGIDIAQELDNVVAKFEEEMTKAEKG